MKTILEYLKRRDIQDYTPEPVQMHYNGSGKPDGIEIQENGLHFILSLKDSGTGNWISAMEKAASLGRRLATKEEWKLIYKYLNQISDLLRSHGKGFIKYKEGYWTSEEYNDHSSWFFYDNNTLSQSLHIDFKNVSNIIRTVKDV